MENKRVHRAADALVLAYAGRAARIVLTLLGVVVVIIGLVIAPLPGPLGVPVMVVGLMLILRNSFKARRQFVRFQQSHPKIARPLRRLLRRDPEVILFFWEQFLRLERLLLPPRWRRAVLWRRKLKRRRSR